jgi:hypothetical protein
MIRAGARGFFVAILGIGPGAGGGVPGNDPISRLHNRLNELSSNCAIDLRDASGACAQARVARADLGEAYAALNREIEGLQVQMGPLQKDCAAHVAGACAKLNRVKERLETTSK